MRLHGAGSGGFLTTGRATDDGRPPGGEPSRASHPVATWNVIDGQQRLTTLQLLADATSAILADAGDVRLAAQLERLTHNDDIFVEEGGSRLKVRHLNKDRAAFDEVMTAEPPVDHRSLVHHSPRLSLHTRTSPASSNSGLGSLAPKTSP